MLEKIVYSEVIAADNPQELHIMKNFKASVPSNIQTKMSTLSQAIFDNWDKIVVGSMLPSGQVSIIKMSMPVKSTPKISKL